MPLIRNEYVDPMRPLEVETIAAWADQLQALARSGLGWTEDPHDRDRFERIVAIAAAMNSALSGETPVQLRTWWAAEDGYITPKVVVSGAIFDDAGSILLGERWTSGLWALPAGFAEVGESAAQSAVREVQEETGLIVRPERLLGVYDVRAPKRLRQLYSIVFWCSVQGGALTPSAEMPQLGYFPRDALPPLSPGFAREVEDAFAAWHDGWLGTAFDR